MVALKFDCLTQADKIEQYSGEKVSDWEGAKYFHFDGNGYWVVEYNNGTFHTLVGNEDEIFNDKESAFKFVVERM